MLVGLLQFRQQIKSMSVSPWFPPMVPTNGSHGSVRYDTINEAKQITPSFANGDWNICRRSATRLVKGQFPGVPLAVALHPRLSNSVAFATTSLRFIDIRVATRRHSIATGKVAIATTTRGTT